MDQQPKRTLDLSHPFSISLVDQNKLKLQSMTSNEEQRIRSELEMDIERDLEQEIKDGIYHLALRLHRLYQHQKERNNMLSECGAQKNQQQRRNKILSEVNISIKLEGGTKVEIKETKKEPTRPRSSSSSAKGMVDTKRFDWARSLRSSSGSAGPTPINRRSERPYLQGKRLNSYMNLNLDDNGRRNLSSAAGQRKMNATVDKLELGWKC